MNKASLRVRMCGFIPSRGLLTQAGGESRWLGAQSEWYSYQDRNFPGDFSKGVPTLSLLEMGYQPW